MAASAVSLKYLTKREEVRKLEKELIRLNVNDVFFTMLHFMKRFCQSVLNMKV